jgi:hypothetical protein
VAGVVSGCLAGSSDFIDRWQYCHQFMRAGAEARHAHKQAMGQQGAVCSQRPLMQQELQVSMAPHMLVSVSQAPAHACCRQVAGHTCIKLLASCSARWSAPSSTISCACSDGSSDHWFTWYRGASPSSLSESDMLRVAAAAAASCAASSTAAASCAASSAAASFAEERHAASSAATASGGR